MAGSAPFADISKVRQYAGMQKIPETNAELRQRLAPMRTLLSLIIIGAVLTPLRDALYGIPVWPLGLGLFPLITTTIVGAIYAVAIEIRLAARRIFVR